MASVQVYVKIPDPIVQEGASFTATTYFRQSGGAQASTTARYRVDCLTTGKVLTDWTSLTVSASITVEMNATVHNLIQDANSKWERKQLTVEADQTLATATRDTVTWKVINNNAF